MENDTSIVVEEAFEKEVGIDVYTAMRILTRSGISLEDMSDITNKCKNVLTEEIEKRNIPYELRFLLISTVTCRLFKTSTAFHKEYMKSVENIPYDKYKNCPNVELVKDP
jgi:intergrase/recombinase